MKQPMNPDILFEQLNKNMIKIKKLTESTLKRMFGQEIKQNFLIEILNRVKQSMGQELYHYYDLSCTNEQIVSGDQMMMEYDIARMIVGIHRSRLIFLDESERVVLEKKEEYKKELISDVISHIKMRNYASVFFRNKPILLGDRFIFYPVPYKLFVMTIRCNEILTQDNKDGTIRSFYVQIFNKAFAALTLLEDNLLDNAYPICRSLIELFLKIHVIELNPGLDKEYDIFNQLSVEKMCNGGKYTDEFNHRYMNRKNKLDKLKNNFAQYGWVDSIKDYHNIVKTNQYSIYGLIYYLKKKVDYGEALESLRVFYSICHTFTHGNNIVSKYPLLSYFEISAMLSCIIPRTFELLCFHTGGNSVIEGIDVLRVFRKDFEILKKQYQEKSTEKFEEYYNNKKRY